MTTFSLILSIYGAILSTYIFWYNVKFKTPSWMLLARQGEPAANGEHNFVIQLYNRMSTPLVIWDFSVEVRDGDNYKICHLHVAGKGDDYFTLTQGTVIRLSPVVTILPYSQERLVFSYLIDKDTEFRKTRIYERRKYYLTIQTADRKEYKI